MPSVNHPTPPGFIRRRGPKGRIVFEPTDEAYEIHRQFLKTLGKVGFPDQIECISPHLKNRFFWKIDLQDAFDSVSEWDIEVFLDISFGDEGKYFFHRKGGLIQGAPASHILFNLYCAEILDEPLREYCQKNNLTYTRYVDDLLFSDSERIGKKRRRAVRDVIKTCGFVIKERKVRLLDTKHTSFPYLGVGIFRNHVYLPRAFLAKLQKRDVYHPRKKLMGKALEEWRDKRMEGLHGWKRRALALNVKKG
mgnify:CR=1 FL=1